MAFENFGNRLPYPYDRIVASPVDPTRVPLPRPKYIDPRMEEAYPGIVAATVEAIQRDANRNPLRVFFFNQMAANGYQNEDFRTILDIVIRFFEMNVQSNQVSYDLQGASKIASFVCELATVKNADTFPDLQQTVPPEGHRDALAAIEAFNRMADEIERYFRGSRTNTSSGWGQSSGGYGQSSAQNQGVPRSQFSMGRINQQESHWQPSSSQVSNASALFNASKPAPTQGNWSNAQLTTTTPETDWRGNPVDGRVVQPKTVPQVVQRQQEVQTKVNPVVQSAAIPPAPAPANADDGLLKAYRDVEWRSSETYPFSIAFDPQLTNLYYRVQNNLMKPAIVPKTEEEIMDYSKHFIPQPSFVKHHVIGADPSLNNVRQTELMQSMEQEYADDEYQPEVCAIRDDTAILSECSEKEIWAITDVQLACMRKKNGRQNLGRRIACVKDMLVCEEDPRPYVNAIASCVTLKDASDLMNVIAKKGLDGKKISPKVMTYVNDRLTNRLNHFTQRRFGITRGIIDSFMEDAGDLVKWMHSNMGERYGSTLEANEGNLIKSALKYCQDQLNKDLNEELLSGMDTAGLVEGTDFHVLNFIDHNTFTSVGLMAHELGFEVGTERSSVGIIKKHTPLMYAIASNIFAQVDDFISDNPDQVLDHHYLKSADGVVMEITRSPILADFYLVIGVDCKP